MRLEVTYLLDGAESLPTAVGLGLGAGPGAAILVPGDPEHYLLLTPMGAAVSEVLPDMGLPQP